MIQFEKESAKKTRKSLKKKKVNQNQSNDRDIIKIRILEKVKGKKKRDNL